jgi:hypothetical protein
VFNGCEFRHRGEVAVGHARALSDLGIRRPKNALFGDQLDAAQSESSL